MYDIVIVGNGPAALSCAITARMRGMTALFVGPQSSASWLARAERIDNYPGLPEVSGADLIAAFKAQALALGAEERVGLVRQILPNDGNFMLLVESDVVEAKTVLLAMGAARPVLLDGEEALVGMGVSYCATCDGMLYRSKRIAVLSATHEGAEEAHFLASLAASIDYFALKSHETGAMPATVSMVAEQPLSLARVPEGIRPKERAREPMPRAMSRTTGAIARWTSMAAVLRAAIACFVWPVSDDSWAAAILLAALRSEVALM